MRFDVGGDNAFRPVGETVVLNIADLGAVERLLAHGCQRLVQCGLLDGIEGKGLRAALQTLPPLPQHGDLVLNNLGLRPDRGLVVFDWEDYAATSLPGLDLFTLENSIQQDLEAQSSMSRAGLSRPALDPGRREGLRQRWTGVERRDGDGSGGELRHGLWRIRLGRLLTRSHGDARRIRDRQV